MTDNTNYDNYRYDNNSRRTVRADSGPRLTAAPRTAKRTAKERPAEKPSSPSILYDARGVRVKKSRFSNEFIKTLLFLVIPYIVINTAIFIIVTATPKVEVSVSDTDNYTSVTAKFTVSSLLPLKDVAATMESEPIEFTKSGSAYTAEITKNGTFYIEATAVNGMRAVGYADVSVLDDTPPIIDETSCHIEEGILTFTISDSQAGVNWSSVFGISSDKEKVTPSSIDKEKGRVAIPMVTDSMELHFSDMVGNERTASVTATTEQLLQSGPVINENGSAEESRTEPESESRTEG